MADIVRWARLETGSRDRELAPGLEARLYDPLWMLGRQWQFGEFAAGRGGSAIAASVSATVAPLNVLKPARVGQGVSYRVGGPPLEAVVEADDVHGAPTLRMRVRAGQQFERYLAARGMSKYAGGYRTAYGVAATDAPDDGSRRFATVVAGRAIDGEKLARDLRGGTLPATPAIAAGDDQTAVKAAAQAWLAWFDSLVLGAAGAPASWTPERLEYTFSVSASDGIEYAADEYTDGKLDWHTFTTNSTAFKDSGRTALGPVTVVPSAVTYPGMPASRLWEFEDGHVNFGAVDAEPTDLGRLLLSGFALVYGADWLVVPLEVPMGSVARITKLDVRDTFGQVTTIGPTAPGGEWNMFGVTRAAGPPEAALLVAPALPTSLQGRDLEEVLLLRDEAANLAWAVERSVEGADGRPADQAQAAHQAVAPAPPVLPPAGTLPYRLRTDPPPYWFPLLPQRAAASNPAMTFKLGPASPRGRLLPPLAGVALREDEVPREGARVTRAYQLARWVDGSTYLWLGRRKAIGRGEGSSGLRFDSTDG